MKRYYSWPEGHWNWPVALTHKHGVRCDGLVFTGGQASLDSTGVVQFAGDLDAQLELVLDYLEKVLLDLDAGFKDLVKLVCYFTGDATDEARMFDVVSQRIGPDVMPVINSVNMPELCYPGMRVEIEGVAMCAEGHASLNRQNIRLDSLMPLHASFSHAVRCGELIFTSDISALAAGGASMHPGDIVEQTTLVMERLTTLLDAAGCTALDVVKINTYYRGDGSAENWETPARIRANFFDDPGPAATGLVVDSFAQRGLMTKLFVTAMRAADGNELPKKFVWPEGHWDWTAPLPYKHGNQCSNLIHLGGQVSLDTEGQVLDPDDMVTQTRTAMENIKTILTELGASLDNVVKVTTFYQGQASADELHQNLQIRSASYTEPGPATTGVPVPCLVYPNMVIEIEVIAML